MLKSWNHPRAGEFNCTLEPPPVEVRRYGFCMPIHAHPLTRYSTCYAFSRIQLWRAEISTFASMAEAAQRGSLRACIRTSASSDYVMGTQAFSAGAPLMSGPAAFSRSRFSKTSISSSG